MSRCEQAVVATDGGREAAGLGCLDGGKGRWPSVWKAEITGLRRGLLEVGRRGEGIQRLEVARQELPSTAVCLPGGSGISWVLIPSTQNNPYIKVTYFEWHILLPFTN